MKKKIPSFFTLIMLFAFFSPNAAMSETSRPVLAQLDDADDEDDFDFDEDADEEELEARRKAEEEKRRRAEEERKRQELERKRKMAEQKRLKARKREEALKRELDAALESGADTTEYTINPENVSLAVELDPKNYGFRQRNHRMIFGTQFDLILAGRAMLNYEFRFFEYFTLGAKAGMDWSALSLYHKIKQDLDTAELKFIGVLGGLYGKWRVTEWYLRSSIFIEPSFIFGHVWQELDEQETKHWRIEPGLYAGVDTVFDSGFNMTFKGGVEFPMDFGKPNPIKNPAVPLLLFGLGFAL